MRSLLAAVALLAAGGAASAQSLSISAALSPRGWPAGVSVPSIAATDKVYPGCPVPPTSFGNTWNINPSTGQTQAAYTTAGVSLNPLVTPHQGDATHPWNSLQAVFKTTTGYTAPLLATVPGGQSVIQAGDDIVLATGSYGDLVIGAHFSPGSQVVSNPAITISTGSGQTPVFTSINVGETSGLVLDGTLGDFKVQNHLSANNPLISIQDGSVSGFVATNIVLIKMDVSSDSVATSDTWSQATWQANGNIGIGIQASDTQYSKITCASVVNSHVYVVQGHNIGAINMWASNTLTQNNEIDHFATDAIEHAGSNVAIRLNYVHDAVLTQPGDQYFMVNNIQDQGNGHQSNVTLDHNRVIESIDAAQLLQAHMGFYISSKGDITNFTAYDNLFAGTGGGLEVGTTHNTLIANNSIMGEIIDVQQGHAGILGTGTGPVGAPPSNVRMTNNIAGQFALSGSGIINLQADHNIVTNTTANPWVYEYIYSTIFLGANPGSLTTVASAANTHCGCSDTGASNLMDGFGPGNEFTAVPTSGSFPMSPQPDWTPKAGSPAATMGGAVLIPAISDFNGVPFSSPYAIGALNPAPPNPILVLPTGDTLKFIATSGNGGSDSNDGLAATVGGGHGPWLTPNHAVNCGDVIIAGPAGYSSGFNTWGAVSNCPSTTGGIDGTGGIYFATLLCGGSDLEACNMNVNTGGDAFGVNKNNWAIEGWKTTAGSGNAYIIEAASSGTVQVHHVAFINDICYDSQQGFQGDDGGLNQNVPGNGVDYNAFVGDIAKNCAQSGFGVAGINVVLPSPFDSVPGTHIFVHGNYSFSNDTSSSCCDGEDYMIDSLDWHGYANQVVVSNNIGYKATRAGFQFTYGGCHQADVPTVKVYNNSIYASNQTFTSTDFFNSEFNFGYNPTACPGVTTSTWNVSMTNNIGQTNKASQNGEPIYGLTIDAVQWLTLVDSGNFFNASATISHGTPFPASAPFSATYANSNTHSVTDTYTTPSFTNVSDLMTNRTGTPTCTGFLNSAQCMGYDAVVSALTVPSVISDFVPTASGTGGKGYQLPSVTCAPNPDFPPWLKAIVFLHWNAGSSTITENAGLVNKPCGM